MVILTMVYFMRVFERLHAETLSFHLLVDKMNIKLDNVSCLLHISIIGTLLYHSITSRPEALDLIVTYLGVDSGKAQEDINDTRGCHTKFFLLVKNYVDPMNAVVDVAGDDTWVAYHSVCAFRSYSMILIGTTIFVDKTATYVDIV